MSIRAVWEFQKRHGHYPTLEHKDQVVEIAKEINEAAKKDEELHSLEELDEKVIA